MNKNPGTDTLILLIILVAGCVLRFYNYFQLPFSYDEFSALFRTRFDSFSDLIRLGVVSTDTHPAGIQVFMYYWVRLFGEGEATVKLPFLLAGIGSIYLAYKIASDWFNPSVGLITAMFVSFLQYPITYSQYARPYATGLFLALLFVWFLNRAFIHRKNNWHFYAAAYVIAGALNAYNHHFSLFFIGLAGISGLLLVPRERTGSYIFSNVFIFLLYLPHIGIFLEQLNKGGIESWLKKPTGAFFPEYFSYILHHSFWMIGVASLLFVFTLFSIRKTWRNGNKYRLVILFWLVATYATAYFYSIHRNAVLQYSVLLFTFPFLVMLVFSYAGKLKPGVKWVILVVFGTISIYSLIEERKHYQIQYQSVLQETFAETYQARQKYGNDQVACMTNISQKIQQYYSDRYHVDPGTVIHFDSSTNYIALREQLQNLPGEYLAVGWVNVSNLEAFAVAREVFPVLVDYKYYYTGDYYLLSKTRNPIDTILMDTITQQIRIDSLAIYEYALSKKDTMLFEHNRLLMPGWLGFGTFYEVPVQELIQDPDQYLFVSIQVENPKPPYESLLICEIKDDDEVVYWTGNPLSKFTRSDWGRFRIHVAVKMADLDLNYSGEEIHLYLSNIDEEYYYINYFQIDILEGNPILYSLFQKIPE